MSFFFDVFCEDGFALVSEQIEVEKSVGIETRGTLRKISSNPYFKADNPKTVNCAIVVCGDYPRAVLSYFNHACALGDTLRDVAKRFAEKWTDKYQPEDGELWDSAVHLVGFERIPDFDVLVPQMWYWTTWVPEDNQMKFYTKKELEEHLQSFGDHNPHNNHMCRIFANSTKASIPENLLEEYEFVTAFLDKNSPYITWNGDRDLWGSALHAAQALQPVISFGWQNTLENLAELTNLCIEFLVKINSFLPDQTLSLVGDGVPDVLLVSATGQDWYSPKGPKVEENGNGKMRA